MSRVHVIGNIYTRVHGLIRKNHISEINKPIWFDVYKHFPPKYNPIFSRMEPEMNIKNIFYKEDSLRAKIHKVFEGHLGEFNLQGSEQSNSQRLLKSCMEYISQGMSEDEAINKLKASSHFNIKSNKDREEESTQTKVKGVLDKESQS